MEEKLDLILKEFLKEGLYKETNPYIITGRIDALKDDANSSDLIEFLKEEGYLKLVKPGMILVQLTAKGKYHILNGGFTKQKNDREEIVSVSKSSLKYAKNSYRAALWIGVLGIIVSLVIYFLSRQK